MYIILLIKKQCSGLVCVAIHFEFLESDIATYNLPQNQSCQNKLKLNWVGNLNLDSVSGNFYGLGLGTVYKMNMLTYVV